jgi:thiol-disulfide isomerase/thioredoxin
VDLASADVMKKTRALAIAAALVALGLLALAVNYARQVGASLAGGPAGTSTMPVKVDSTPGAENAPVTVRFVKNPKPVPALSIPDLAGRTISSADWVGKTTIVNFWATWCPPCIKEIPDFIALQAKYADHLRIIGFSIDEGPAEQVRAFVAEHGMNYPVAIAGPDVAPKFGGVYGIPTTFVIDAQGRVVQKHVGLISPAVYEQEVRALAGLPLNAKVETIEDTGQVSLDNAVHATSVPGVDLAGLTPAQKATALKRLNSDTCTCGCALTLAQCRINDTSCDVSLPLAKEVVAQVKGGG